MKRGRACPGRVLCPSSGDTMTVATLTEWTRTRQSSDIPSWSGVCAITLTSAAGACTPATNKYDVTGSLTFSDAPTTGTLTVSDGSITQVFNAPFTSPQAYTLSGLTADGASHTVTAVFSADGACTNTSTYTAPASCAVAPVCAITLTSAAGACTPATNKYNVTGSLTFSTAPSTGTLTVSMGAITQVFNAPFTSPQAYTLSGLTADGASHTVTAVFSPDGACTNTRRQGRETRRRRRGRARRRRPRRVEERRGLRDAPGPARRRGLSPDRAPEAGFR